MARSTATFGPDDDETVRCQASLAQGYDIAEKPGDAGGERESADREDAL